MIFKLVILIFSFLNLLNLILNLKNKSTVLSCGLGAYNGSEKPNEMLLRIIGQFNEIRGTHSCGKSNDFTIEVGINSNRVFSDFISNYKRIGTYKKTNNVILHTRKATVGLHTAENAHPFGFGETEDVNDFVGAHNGSLLDWDELVPTEERREKNLTIDSKVLLYRIYKDKGFKVLSEYKGAAALLFYSKDNPDRLYAFKGAAGGEEERPLFYCQVKKNNKITGVYLSSLKEPFLFSGFDEEDIKEVPNNTLLYFEGGKIAKKITISRPKELSTEGVRKAQRLARITEANKQIGFNFERGGNHTQDSSKQHCSVSGSPYPSVNIPTFNNSYEKLSKSFNASENLFKVEFAKNKIMYKFLRYWQNGRILHGIYIIDIYGNIEGQYENIVLATDKIKTLPKKENYKIYYMLFGAMMKDESAYYTLCNIIANNQGTKVTTSTIAKYSKYPIFTLNSRKLSKITPTTVVHGKQIDEKSRVTIHPDFSLFCFQFDNGAFTGIQYKMIYTNYIASLVQELSGNETEVTKTLVSRIKNYATLNAADEDIVGDFEEKNDSPTESKVLQNVSDKIQKLYLEENEDIEDSSTEEDGAIEDSIWSIYDIVEKIIDNIVWLDSRRLEIGNDSVVLDTMIQRLLTTASFLLKPLIEGKLKNVLDNHPESLLYIREQSTVINNLKEINKKLV